MILHWLRVASVAHQTVRKWIDVWACRAAETESLSDLRSSQQLERLMCRRMSKELPYDSILVISGDAPSSLSSVSFYSLHIYEDALYSSRLQLNVSFSAELKSKYALVKVL